MKTIKEISDMLGVSKQSIQYHIKKLTTTNDFDKYMTKVGREFRISKEGENLLIQSFEGKQSTMDTKTTNDTYLLMNIKSLSIENDYLKQQIEYKDKQIETLTNTLIERVETKRGWKFWKK